MLPTVNLGRSDDAVALRIPGFTAQQSASTSLREAELLNGGSGFDAGDATANIFRSDEPNLLAPTYTNRLSGDVGNGEEMNT